MSAARLPLALATVCTGSGLVMAAAAAGVRGTTALDVGLLMSWAAILALGAHLLPALAQRLPRGWQRGAWLVWVGCVLATLYSHTHYMHAAAQRAGAARAGAVVVDSAAARALAADLAVTQARPVALVAAEHAKAQGASAKAAAALAQCRRRPEARCDMAEASATAATANAEALATELDEARRSAALREQQRTHAAEVDAQRTAAQADPVDAAIAQALGVRAEGVGLLISVAMSLLLDVLAALLWRMALPGAAEQALPTAVPVVQVQAKAAAKTPANATAPLTQEPPARGWWRPAVLRRVLPQARDRPLIGEFRLMPV